MRYQQLFQTSRPWLKKKEISILRKENEVTYERKTEKSEWVAQMMRSEKHKTCRLIILLSVS